MSDPSSPLPDQMQVILADPPGGPQVMRLASRNLPTPSSGEVLIKVAAAGVNGADLREREGKYPVPPGAPDIMGLEASGEIVAVGPDCQRFEIGDRVCALLIGGGYGEYALAPEGQCMAIPQGVSLQDAAGLPEVFCTVWTNMMDRCALQSGESVLIQGGTSGIGHHLSHGTGHDQTTGSDILPQGPTQCRPGLSQQVYAHATM